MRRELASQQRRQEEEILREKAAAQGILLRGGAKDYFIGVDGQYETETRSAFSRSDLRATRIENRASSPFKEFVSIITHHRPAYWQFYRLTITVYSLR